MGKQISFYIFPHEFRDVIDIFVEFGLVPVLMELRNSNLHKDKIAYVGNETPIESAKLWIQEVDFRIGMSTKDSIKAMEIWYPSSTSIYIKRGPANKLDLDIEIVYGNKLKLSRIFLETETYDSERNWVPTSPELISLYEKVKRKLIKKVFVRHWHEPYLYYLSKEVAEGIKSGKYRIDLSPSRLTLLEDLYNNA
jgi:hypothetical protein